MFDPLNCDLNEYKKTKIEEKMDENNYMVDYGICTGVINYIYNKVFTRSHFYKDGKQHCYSSDGLCPECFEINEKFRAQRKITKLEEKSNEQKRLDLLKVFDILNMIES
ncbi:MAG: hypothetical protein NT139_02740 [Candidatus Woesearchaeota archaeon]|nr:hypothetical protein [Candidatus Woesearchaeota archaeon]